MGKKKRNSRWWSTKLPNTSTSSSFSPVSKDDSECEGIIPEIFFVSSVEASGCDIYVKKLRSEWKDTVFLNPSTMREANIVDLVLIIGEEKLILCKAYPVEKLKRNIVVFPKRECPFKYQENVGLQNYDGEVKCANSIFITLDEEIDASEYMKKYILRLLSNQYIFEGLEVKWKFFDRDYHCFVKSINHLPDDSKTKFNTVVPEFYTLSYKTTLKVIESEKISVIHEIGGLQKEIHLLNVYIQKFLNRSTYCGILLFEGPSGTGKSLLLQTVLADYSVFKIYIMWHDLLSMSQSDVRQTLDNTFQEAINNAPSIIVIEEFNYLCPNKNDAEDLHCYISQRISQFLKALNDTKVMLIATVNNSEYDISILQQSGRLLEVMKFKIPTAVERIDILSNLLNRCNHELSYEQVETCAKLAHGFTGKDLMETIKDAQVIVCKREFSHVLDSNKNNKIGNIKYGDLYFCIKLKKKSIITADDIKVKKVRWSDIGGMDGVKEKLKEIVELPIKHPELFKHFNTSPSRGILMYGPPGCSKTMIAKALATECELNFISKNAADLYNKYVGESERAVRDLFALAKAKSPCIIFLDEIDGLVTGRESSSGSSGVENRLITTLLTEMDGIEELHGVVIIAATNRPDMLDAALVRNGRINHFIYVPLPDVATREEILKISMSKRSVSEDFDLKLLAQKTEGYSGAEIVNLCNEAAFQLLIENPESKSPVFRLHHFECALKRVLPRTNKEMIQFYETFNETHCT